MIPSSQLGAHADGILDFYRKVSAAHPGRPFPQTIDDQGRVLPDARRHLVSSTRLCINFCRAWLRWQGPADLELARRLHAEWLEHRSPEGNWAWMIEADGHRDEAPRCYGAAIDLLTAAWSQRAGLCGPELLQSCYAEMELNFNLPGEALFGDERDASGQLLPYRGQNANMHSVEALLAAHAASGDQKYLDRASAIARRLVLDLAPQSEGWICEHYRQDWSADWDFHRDNPRDLYKPWGFQTGHLTEWSKLLVQLRRRRPDDPAYAWILPAATRLSLEACQAGWDTEHQGLVYGFDRQRRPCDEQKHFWVQAESFAALALLEQEGVSAAAPWADRLWHYSQQRWVIPGLGGPWFRVLERDHSATDHTLAVPGGKVDYHSAGAILDVLGS